MLTFAIIIFLIGVGLDFHSTKKALELGAYEKNPITRWLIEKTGKLWAGAIIVDLAIFALLLSLYSLMPGFILIMLFVGGLAQIYVARNNYKLADKLTAASKTLYDGDV